MEIPFERLSPDLLTAIIKEFVLQEGTDYGTGEYSLEEKIEQVKSQLKGGSAVVVFDHESETCHIVSAKNLST